VNQQTNHNSCLERKYFTLFFYLLRFLLPEGENMNSFNKAMEAVSTEKKTKNGAKTYSTSLSNCLDLFALGGSVRDWGNNAITGLFSEAYRENPIIATKLALYIRDVREGMGERKVGRIFFNYIADRYAYNKDPMIFKIIPHIADVGRWDDLINIFYEAKNDAVRKEIIDIIFKQLKKDNNSDNPSLLAKWLPSINSGVLSRKKALEILKYINISNKNYRRMLSILRKKIDIVETKVTQGNFSKIDYEKVPSQSMMRYNRIFRNKDLRRFSEYLNKVKTGNAKINTRTIYPYQIVEDLLKEKIYSRYNSYNNREAVSDERKEFLDVTWEKLPDFTNDSKAIVMADTSGSMYSSDLAPLCVSISLATYFAERNTGPFKDKFITFSYKPTFHSLKGDSLSQKINNVDFSGWSKNTDISKAFKLILNTAIKYDVPQEDMPETLYIVSDMEFDKAIDSSYNSYYDRNNIELEKTNFQVIEKMYSDAGYEMPTLVFWNVNALNKTIPVRYDENGTILVSGKSPTVFSLAMEKSSPQAFMLKILEDRYLFVE